MLDILKDYPFYSFTLDASANLESYLSTHDGRHQKQLLDYLTSADAAKVYRERGMVPGR